MALKGLEINGISSKVPIIQGGMGVGISLSNLAGAVAREGGIGMISAAQPGFNHEGFDQAALETNLEALADHIKAAKEKAAGGIVGVNIMCAATYYEKYVRCCMESHADLIISGAGLPMDLPKQVMNSTIKIAPIVSSVKAVKVLLTLWDRRYQRTADMIVVEGPKAGGHLAFSPDQLEKDIHFDLELMGIIDYVKQVEEKYQRHIPVVFAGGVYDRRDIDHYLDLGCAGVQMATRFVATEECDADEGFKQAYIDAKREDITIIKSPVGMPARALNNTFLKKTLSQEKENIDHCHKCIKHCDLKTAPYCITKALSNSAKGNLGDGLILCGENVYRIDKIITVKALMDELCRDT